MRSKSYYLIAPNDALSLRELEFESALWEYLITPQLIESVSGGRSPLSESGHYARAKYAFLINLFSERLTDEEVQLLIGSEKISQAFFDKYWDIKYVEVEGSTEDIDDHSVDRSSVELSGIELVDSWLSSKLK